MRTSFFLALVCFFYSAHATNYYFSSSSGSDSRTSTQAKNASTPWKSLNKLNSFFSNLQPGDSVLFKRGETFYGSVIVNKSGTSGSPIVIGAYGSGSKPIITSLVTLSGWTANSTYKGVYDCSANSLLGEKVNMVFLNDVQQAIGRYPNSNAVNKGFLTFESHSGKTSITDKELTSAPNWKGAELVLRTARWIIERCKITSHSGSTLYFSTSSEPRNKYGYFIQNDIKTLDQRGEWYYNPATHKISMFFGSNSPSSYTVKATTINNLVSAADRSYVVFDNLTIKGANENGFEIDGGSGVSIKNCEVLYSGENGVQASSHTNFKLENSTILHSNNNGVSASSSNNYAVIRNNIIKHSFHIVGMGKSGQGQGAGIKISTTGLAEYNQVINSGFVGISFWGDNAVVKNNFIDTFCFVKDDGGGIYASNGTDETFHGRKVTGNIVMNGVGAPAGTDSENSSADGIYMDDDVNAVEISGNTVTNSNRGFYFHNTRQITVKNNTAFNNNNGQLHMKNDPMGGLLRNHTITNNIFFSKLSKQVVSSLNTNLDNNDLSAIGRFDSNYYARPIDDRVTISNTTYLYTSNEYRTNINLEAWKLKSGKDVSSKTSAKKIAPYRVKSLIGSGKFAYGKFNTSTDVKKVWPNNCSISWQSSGSLDGGYLKVVPSAKSSSIVVNVGDLSTSKKYILKYSLKGSSNMSMGAYLRASNYDIITTNQLRPVSTSRTENEMIFTPSVNQTSGSLTLIVDAQSTYYIDNITFHEVDAIITNPDDSIKLVFNASQVNKTFALNGNYVDVKNNKFSSSITLRPYASAVLIKDGGETSNSPVKIPPAISITSPVVNASYTAAAAVNMVASATDADGNISKVQFYNGTTLLHIEYHEPYTFTWNNVPAGSYTITAKATDNDGLVTVSAPIKISVAARSYRTSNGAVTINIDTTKPEGTAADKKLDFKLFPNPAVNTIHLDFGRFESYKKATLVITNLSGSILQKYPVAISGKYLQVDISSLNTGMFIISIATNHFSISRKFVKIN